MQPLAFLLCNEAALFVRQSLFRMHRYFFVENIRIEKVQEQLGGLCMKARPMGDVMEAALVREIGQRNGADRSGFCFAFDGGFR